MSTIRSLKVEIVTRLHRLPLSASRCRRLLEQAALLAPPARRGPAPFVSPALTVLFAGDARMRSLNARYRGVDATTDVLSFPAAEDGRASRLPNGPYLGDVAISVPVARRQALRRGHDVAREVEFLLLHGYLHLLGYDHERDQGQMDRVERGLRRKLGLLRRQGNP